MKTKSFLLSLVTIIQLIGRTINWINKLTWTKNKTMPRVKIGSLKSGKVFFSSLSLRQKDMRNHGCQTFHFRLRDTDGSKMETPSEIKPPFY